MKARLLLLLVASLVAQEAAADLPPTLQGAANSPVPAAQRRAWTIPDIVEIARITSVATRPSGGAAAFVVQRPSLALGRDAYGLYAVGDAPGPARKLFEARYIDEVQPRPGGGWTVRADLGQGVQLYEVDLRGGTRPLVINRSVVAVGGMEGALVAADQGARQTGIVSYQWAPDGRSLWYASFRSRPAAALRAYEEAANVYDEKLHYYSDFTAPPAAEAMELHVFEPATKRDRVVATMEAGRNNLIFASFNRRDGSTKWLDAQRISYRSHAFEPNGERTVSRFVVDTRTGLSELVSGHRAGDGYALALPDGELQLEPRDGEQHLLRYSAAGGTQDLGAAPVRSLSGDVWIKKSGALVLGVSRADAVGLLSTDRDPVGMQIAASPETLDGCAFDAEVASGYCVRESQDRPPELVALSLRTGAVEVVARPNAKFDSIEPLRTEAARWTNRFGAQNDGYVTYPSGYVPGQAYPVLVVTHGRDAQNRFAYHGLQWEFPVQAMAAQGYVVLQVNEPRAEASVQAAALGADATPVAKMQFSQGYNVVAGMEAAAQAAIDAGLADPQRIGIAGYSRGSEVTQLALAHGSLFRAGAAADDTWFNPGGYWTGGLWGKGVYQRMFGGPITDPSAYEAYRTFSPAARAKQFSGPLLQLFAAPNAMRAQELYFALRDAGVPTELQYFRDETHLLHHPRRRASAMQSVADWFDFWLQGKEDADPAKAAQYERWRKLREQRRGGDKAT